MVVDVDEISQATMELRGLMMSVSVCVDTSSSSRPSSLFSISLWMSIIINSIVEQRKCSIHGIRRPPAFFAFFFDFFARSEFKLHV